MEGLFPVLYIGFLILVGVIAWRFEDNYWAKKYPYLRKK